MARPASRGATGLDLAVLDLGLDFRSYQAFVDSSRRPILGNTVRFPAELLVDMLDPTVGLFITILQLYANSRSGEAALRWLQVYADCQDVFRRTTVDNNESWRWSLEATQLIDAAANALHPSRRFFEQLLVRLDKQCGMDGCDQAPSRRRMSTTPKGMLCNLHLSNHRCNQDFACNQVHLHHVGSTIPHRIQFHRTMVHALRAAGCSEAEIQHRVKDSLLYAKYGNRVTVRIRDTHVPLFKTQYTPARLEAALYRRYNGLITPQAGPLHVGKAMDLMNPDAVAAELEAGWREVYVDRGGSFAAEAAAGLSRPERVNSSGMRGLAPQAVVPSVRNPTTGSLSMPYNPMGPLSVSPFLNQTGSASSDTTRSFQSAPPSSFTSSMSSGVVPGVGVYTTEQEQEGGHQGGLTHNPAPSVLTPQDHKKKEDIYFEKTEPAAGHPIAPVLASTKEATTRTAPQPSTAIKSPDFWSINVRRQVHDTEFSALSLDEIFSSVVRADALSVEMVEKLVRDVE